MTAPIVLLYHCVEPTRPADDGPPGMIVPTARLEAHVVALQRRGYRFVTAGELARLWRAGRPPDGLAVLTFDDGWRDGLAYGAPLLARLGVRATFFACSDAFGTNHQVFGEIMTGDEVRALHAAGMELGSHTLSHRNVLELSDDELRAELVQSRRAIEELTGEPCLTLAYPSGRNDARVRAAAAAAGYELAFAARPGPWLRFAVPRLQPHTTDSPERLLERVAFVASGGRSQRDVSGDRV